MNPIKRNVRRAFLQRSVAAAVLGSGAFAVNGKMSLIGSALAAKSDYATLTDHKALVCVYLAGGCDTLNLFLPADVAKFKAYTRARGPLAVKSGDIQYSGYGSDRVGFNAGLPELRRIYEAGELGIVQNVGNLLAPVNRLDYLARRPWVPPNLFSHEQQQALLFSSSSRRSPVQHDSGWGGRIANLLEESNENANLPHAFSLSATDQWLSGTELQPLVLTTSRLPAPDYLDSNSDNAGNSAREATLKKILVLQRQHALKKQATEKFRLRKKRSQALQDALGNDYLAADSLPASTGLSASLQMVARMIAENEMLEMKRQVFFVQHNGWDTHAGQPGRLAALMSELDQGLAEFRRTLREQGFERSVTTFTASEFGRALSITADGTDHGWGGHCLVMGGAVNGGKLHGSAATLELGGVDDAGDQGRFIPSTSINQLGAELANWFGLTQSDLNDVFPDLQYFNDTGRLNLFSG